MSNFQLQRVVNGICDRSLEKWLEQRIVNYRVERQSAELLSQVQIGEADIVSGAADGIRGISAISQQLLHSRLRLVGDQFLSQYCNRPVPFGALT